MEQRTRKCVNCAFGCAVVAGMMYCAHPMHYGKLNDISHTCLNWKDRKHGMRGKDESD